jgi:hypothetical protein
MDNNHTGRNVLFLYPTPNSRKLPSFLNKNPGFDIIIIAKNDKNIMIDTRTGLFLTKLIYILCYNIIINK